MLPLALTVSGRAGVEPRALAVRVVFVVLQQPGVGRRGPEGRKVHVLRRAADGRGSPPRP